MSPDMLGPSPGKRAEILLLGSLLLLTVAMFSWLAFIRGFDPDEFQHIEMAWLTRMGEVPYRDFFEHHTPVFHFLLLPFLWNASVVTSGPVAIHAVLSARLFDVLLCVAILLMVYVIARRLASARAALFAVALLMTSSIFVSKGIEIRPDQFATLALLVASYFLLPPLMEKSPDRAVFLSACMITIALLTTQKVAFVVPGFAVAFLMSGRRPQSLHLRGLLRVAAAAASGVAVAVLPVIVYFAAHHALGDFINDNFLLGGHWVHHWASSLWSGAVLFEHDVALIAFALGGLALCIRKKEWLCVTAPLLSMAVLMPLFPVVQRQYIFDFLPFMAVVAGFGVDRILAESGPSRLLTQQQTLAAAVLLAVLAVHGAALVHEEYRRGDNRGQLAKLTYVVEKSPPEALVLRGWSAGVAFRKPAFRYFSLNSEIQAIIPARELDALEEGLRSGAVEPEFVEMDSSMELMPRGIVSVLREKWEPTPLQDLWQLKKGFAYMRGKYPTTGKEIGSWRTEH